MVTESPRSPATICRVGAFWQETSLGLTEVHPSPAVIVAPARGQIAPPSPVISSARDLATRRKSTMPVPGEWSARIPLTAGSTS
jgi:hypothetical protein